MHTLYAEKQSGEMLVKLLQLNALQKQIESSFAAKELSRSFLVLQGVREERRSTLEKIGQQIAKLTGASVLFFEGEQWPRVCETLMSSSLFGEEEVVLWDVGKGIEKGVQEEVLSYIDKPSSRAFLVIGGESAKAFSPAYIQPRKGLVVLDRTEEKPWDKEKRLQQEALALAKASGKNLSAGALSRILASCKGEELLWKSELEKLFLYVLDRQAITEKDVLAICTSPSHQAGWNQAEALVWGGEFGCEEVDLSFLLALLGQVRFLVQQARQLAWLLEEGKSEEELLQLVRIKPLQLQKSRDRLRKYQIPYFEKALDALYEVELLAKNSSLAPKFLLDLLQIRFSQGRKIYGR